jgi:uncharacterized membrane protein YeaQ/YmgE (transglycosylase-associated protein family)
VTRKQLIGFGVLVGSTAGSYVPNLWGAGAFSMSSIIFGALGAFVGIWFGYNYGS